MEIKTPGLSLVKQLNFLNVPIRFGLGNWRLEHANFYYALTKTIRSLISWDSHQLTTFN